MERSGKKHSVSEERTLPNKRRRLDAALEESNSDELSDQFTDDSADEYSYLGEALRESALIENMSIPLQIIDLIEGFGYGDIIQCWNCSQEDHVDDVDDAREELEDNGDWVCDTWNGELICTTCDEERTCTFCFDNEIDYKCDACDNVVCSYCDKEDHVDKHMEMGIELPEGYVDDLLANLYYQDEDFFSEPKQIVIFPRGNQNYPIIYCHKSGVFGKKEATTK